MKAYAVAILVLSLAPEIAEAQLAITNARIIDGTGRTIERGSIIIANGRIASVQSGNAATVEMEVIDARGMTVMPGLIDTHRHDLLGDLRELPLLKDQADVGMAIERATPGKLKALLRHGFTTVMMPGMFLPAALEVRRLLKAGELEGPRLLFSGPGFTAPGDFPVQGMVCQGNAFCGQSVAFEVTDPAAARREVRGLAKAGVDGIKIFVDNTGHDLADSVIAAITDEARSLGLPALLHAHSVEAMVRGVRLGVTRLVHVPGDASIANSDGARRLRENGAMIATTVSMSGPAFAEALGFPYSGADRHRQILDNIRHLADEGVVVAFGTDSPDLLSPLQEIKYLSKVMTPGEIIASLTRDAAVFLNLNDVGTLEAGNIADILIVDGDPLADISQLARVSIVIQAGVVTVDNR